MPPRRRFGKRLVRSFFPIVLVILVALLGSLGFIVYCVSHPVKRPYLVTPQSFAQVSPTVPNVTDESWANHDGTRARGWLLKGSEGAPGVVLLHRYGADRSWLFNLGVKINENTGYTILWPDLRGHGLQPLVKWSSAGSLEDDDLLAALDFLRNLKTESKTKLVRDVFGVYGVELGAYSALKAAKPDNQIRVLVLDSVPPSADEVVNSAVNSCVGLDSSLIQFISRVATKVYLLGGYENTTSCEVAGSLRDQRVLLLSGADAGSLKNDTIMLQHCFPDRRNLDVRPDLPLSGLNLVSATGEQGDSYDRMVIEYFIRNLQ
jgi:pimeloyl-ACP methyl ester carboxylesterase